MGREDGWKRRNAVLMGKMKATLPDYPTVEYISEPIVDKEIKIWAMTEGLKHIKRDGATFATHCEEVRVFAQYLIMNLKKL